MESPTAALPMSMMAIDSEVLDVIRSIPNLPHSVMVWSKIYPGLEVPLQAIRHCYRIDGVTEDDIYMALTLPAYIAGRIAPWEYRPETDSILTTDKLLAACLKQRGRTIAFNAFAVGLVYSEVLEELEHRSSESLQFFLGLLQQGSYFSFRDCDPSDGLKAIASSPEKGMIAYKNKTLTCKSLRIALELVNHTGQLPRMMARNKAVSA